jgi:hypothetical protein
MSEPLDELYFKWLYEQVAVSGFNDRDLTYWKVLKVLFTKEFIWVPDIVNDENRIADGKALRSKFLMAESIYDVDPDWMAVGCSVLELMVGLSRRLEFEADKGKAHYWFWVLLENIGLSGYSDERRFTRRLLDRIDDILDGIIYRNYEQSGLGGFFPLQNSRYDQRYRELWYQMCDYIMEKELAG